MNLITKKHKAKHTMKTYNKSRKLSTQTSFLITLTIALITSISAGLFLQKTYNFRCKEKLNKSWRENNEKKSDKYFVMCDNAGRHDYRMWF